MEDKPMTQAKTTYHVHFKDQTEMERPSKTNVESMMRVSEDAVASIRKRQKKIDGFWTTSKITILEDKSENQRITEKYRKRAEGTSLTVEA